MQYTAESHTDVRKVLASFKPNDPSTSSVAQEFAKRELALREKAKTDPKARAAVQVIDKQRAVAREKYNELVKSIALNGEASLKAEKEAIEADIAAQVKEAKKAYLGWIPGYSYFAGEDKGASSPPPGVPVAGTGK